jgi:hypothetical protein
MVYFLKKYFVLVWGLWMVGVRYLQVLLRVELCFPCRVSLNNCLGFTWGLLGFFLDWFRVSLGLL